MHHIHTPLSRTSHSARVRPQIGRLDRERDAGGGGLDAQDPRREYQRRSTSLQKHSRDGKTGRPEHELEHDTHAGAEPGIDPRSGSANAEYSHFREECVIDVVDYDDLEATFRRMDNEEFVRFLEGEGGNAGGSWRGGEEDVPPLAVRWINIEGIDWKVLSSVALRYNLDSLALEDILHERGHNHSKADYYPNHLFLRVLCHTLETPGDYAESDFFELSEEGSPAPIVPTPPRQDHGGYSAAEQGHLATSGVDSDTAREGVGAAKVPPVNGGDGGSLKSVDSKESFQPLVFPKLQSEGTGVSGDQATLGDGEGQRKAGSPFSGITRAVRRRLSSLSGYYTSERRKQLASLRELKKDHAVEVKKDPLFIFLLRNGTVISIHPSVRDYTAPISERLHHPDSVLRTSDDASLLVESLIDLGELVDRVLEVMDEYQLKISDLEREILIHPSMDAVRCLHIISGDLIMHKRTLDPIKTMIFGLRKYDLDRCIALHDSLAQAKREQQAREEKREHAKSKRKGKHGVGGGGGGGGGQGQGQQHLRPSAGGSGNGNGVSEHSEVGLVRSDDQHLRAMAVGKAAAASVNGYFSYKSKVYLADVYDHMDFALSSLDMFAATTENLINYAFNIASYDMNVVMNRLTLVTIIFLPLTLLTGYFGMNFTPFWSVEHNSDAFFWKLAGPIMAVLIPLFMIHDIKQAWKNWKRRRQDHRAVKHSGKVDGGLEVLG
ncbi:hypothetical protein DFP72DRAFT_1015290 [Ephemerocybe angulata]|uniref:Uncharacterized protein n=1 Tax=Ephemerocybe angulata TaxID=980116 RepID=A0A8H6HJW0_9AGAR|nr:hypothetical protein DFP72DRAFT_1015290 [Tulosesus angulatus]